MVLDATQFQPSSLPYCAGQLDMLNTGDWYGSQQGYLCSAGFGPIGCLPGDPVPSLPPYNQAKSYINPKSGLLQPIPPGYVVDPLSNQLVPNGTDEADWWVYLIVVVVTLALLGGLAVFLCLRSRQRDSKRLLIDPQMVGGPIYSDSGVQMGGVAPPPGAIVHHGIVRPGRSSCPSTSVVMMASQI
jgi:hypothetical protein